jgi:ATP-dependent DNA helicase 2 subunit 1
MDEETATVLMPTDIKKYMTFAGRNIYFLPEEIAEMKHFGTVGLKLISFKALNCLKAKHHIRPAQFLYPNEADIRGSSKLFVALLKKCIDKNVMAVCQYIPRENIAPKFVGLVPQAEELGDEGQQLTPPGFHVIFFPYADDFRTNNPKHKDAHMADKEMIEKGRVRKSRILKWKIQVYKSYKFNGNSGASFFYSNSHLWSRKNSNSYFFFSYFSNA